MKVFISILFLCFIQLYSFGQENVNSKDSIVTIKHHIPKIATQRSAIIPGWGQVYNKQYWKVPLVYGVLAIPAATYQYNADLYSKAKFAYEARFKEAQIKLAIENHDRLTCAEFNEIIDQVGSDWVGICLDTVNSLGAVEAPNTVIPALAPRAINVHMKDFEIVRTNGQMGFTVRGTALGEGRLDVAEVITAVGGTKREITAVIELWTPRQDSYAATVALENEWAKISVTNLRKSIGS